jgi:hypothetical protein
MFQLTTKEYTDLISQNVTSSWGGVRKLPYVFTEHGTHPPNPLSRGGNSNQQVNW